MSSAQTLYTDAAYYRMMFDGRSHDLPFYAELAAGAAGSVLELGVGTGRVALPLARAGAEVVGVDSAPAMLELLAEAAAAEPAAVRERLSWQRAEVPSLELARRFDVVLYPFNGLAHHHRPDEQAAVFEAVHRHLAPGGRFAFDVSVPDPALLTGASSSAPWFRHPRSGAVCRCDETSRYDPDRRVLTFESTIRPMEGDGEPEILTWSLRQFAPHELPRMLAHHGFELVRKPIGLVDATGYVCIAAPD